MQPLQYAIYKGTGGKHGAVQFNLQSPHYYQGKTKDFTGEDALELGEAGRKRLKDGWKIREGCVFMEITSAKGKNEYDWNSKIIFALSVNDIGQVLHTLVTGEECRLMHDPGAKTEAQGAVKKYMTISSPQGTSKGVMIHAAQQSGGEKRSHTVPVSGAEVLVLRTLFQEATAKMLAW